MTGLKTTTTTTTTQFPPAAATEPRLAATCMGGLSTDFVPLFLVLECVFDPLLYVPLLPPLWGGRSVTHLHVGEGIGPSIRQLIAGPWAFATLLKGTSVIL